MYNKVIMIGCLIVKFEMVKILIDKLVMCVIVVVNRCFKGSNGECEVDFINVVMWGCLVEIFVSYGIKGFLILIDGELCMCKYEKDG